MASVGGDALQHIPHQISAATEQLRLAASSST
jgi:hypothetical protein